MEKYKPGFGNLEEKEEVYDSYVGKWVMISHGHNDFSAGKVKEIDKSGVIKLSPYEGIRYHSEFGPLKKLICTKLEEPVLHYELERLRSQI